jgi:non-canonical purine NTP pyrophosphatase (RdgB/HAM1 family)
MNKITFITGNQGKADNLARFLGFPIDHVKIDLDEIQSPELKKVVQHKVHQAYEQIKRPVIIDDVSLEFGCMGRLPGTFIKWFLEDLSLEAICRLLDGKDRSAIGRCMVGYYDGTTEEYLEGSIAGTIAEHPMGENGYGWDAIFIPEGYNKTRAQLTDADYEAVYRKIRPLDELKEFLEQI